MKISVKEAKEWAKRGIIKDKVLIDQLNLIKDAKKNKFGAVKVTYNGMTFDSQLELKRYKELLLLEKIGLITDLKCQEIFLLVPKSQKNRELTYRADFTYFDVEKQKKVVEDTKSKITAKLPTYVAKKKLMLEIYGIEIKEVYANSKTYNKKK